MGPQWVLWEDIWQDSAQGLDSHRGGGVFRAQEFDLSFVTLVGLTFMRTLSEEGR